METQHKRILNLKPGEKIAYIHGCSVHVETILEIDASENFCCVRTKERDWLPCQPASFRYAVVTEKADQGATKASLHPRSFS